MENKRQKIIITLFISIIVVLNPVQALICIRLSPKVSISPLSTEIVAPGQTLIYTVKVTNNDNPTCSLSTFNLSVTSCSGNFKCDLSTQPLKISPRIMGSTKINVTSSSTALVRCLFSISATNRQNASYYSWAYQFIPYNQPPQLLLYKYVRKDMKNIGTNQQFSKLTMQRK